MISFKKTKIYELRDSLRTESCCKAPSPCDLSARAMSPQPQPHSTSNGLTESSSIILRARWAPEVDVLIPVELILEQVLYARASCMVL